MFAHKSWTKGCILNKVNDINAMSKLTPGQGQMVKGQVCTWIYVGKNALSKNHERKVGSYWYLCIESIFINDTLK